MKPMLLLAAAVAALGITPPATGPRSRFNGRGLSGWHIDVPAMDSNASVRNPAVVRHSRLLTRGEPAGHFTTDTVYRDYPLEVE